MLLVPLPAPAPAHPWLYASHLRQRSPARRPAARVGAGERSDRPRRSCCSRRRRVVGRPPRTRSAATTSRPATAAGAWLVGVAGTAAAVSAFTFVGGPGLFAVAGAGSLWIILLGAAHRGAAVLGGRRAGRRAGAAPRRPDPARADRRPLRRRPRGRSAALVVVVGCVASLRGAGAGRRGARRELPGRAGGARRGVAAMLATTRVHRRSAGCAPACSPTPSRAA